MDIKKLYYIDTFILKSKFKNLKINLHRYSNTIESIEYLDILITQKKRTKYLKFYEKIDSSHLNHIKENGEYIIKSLPIRKWKRIKFPNIEHLMILYYIANNNVNNKYYNNNRFDHPKIKFNVFSLSKILFRYRHP